MSFCGDYYTHPGLTLLPGYGLGMGSLSASPATSVEPSQWSTILSTDGEEIGVFSSDNINAPYIAGAISSTLEPAFSANPGSKARPARHVFKFEGEVLFIQYLIYVHDKVN